jgi:arylamine N-acetyltransferase
MSEIANRFLAFLDLEREEPTLDYLSRVIAQHQVRVPFETLTKIVDYEPGLRRQDFLPPIEEYVERIVNRGAGGLCWTLARGLHFLLSELGFDAAFMHMEPGHCCVRVELPEGSYYADVGYAAPIFRAYPLFESFTLETHRERFAYEVTDGGIAVTRNPGPSKRLDPTPRTLDELKPLIDAANDWTTSGFLTRLSYARYVDGVYTSVNDGTLRRWKADGLETEMVAAEDMPALMRDLFRADPSLYVEAAGIHRRYTSGAAAAR